MPVSTQQLDASFQRFLPNFGASLPDQAALERTMLLWAEQFDGQPWVTDAIFQRARNLIITQQTDKYLPPFAVVLDYCHAAKEQIERETERREAEQRLKLPPPKPATTGWNAMSGPQRAAFFERHLAIGKLRGQGVVDPTEQEIAGQVGQQRATRFCHGTLEAIAARENAPLAEVGKEVTGVWPR